MRIRVATRTGGGLRGNTRPGAAATSTKRTRVDVRLETAARIARKAAEEAKALREQGDAEVPWYKEVLDAGPQYGVIPRYWGLDGLVYDTPTTTDLCAKTYAAWYQVVAYYRRKEAAK